MSFDRSNFYGLRNFVNHFQSEGAEYHPDPYNTFLAQMEIVYGGENPFYSELPIALKLMNFHEKLIANTESERKCIDDAKISRTIHHLIEDISSPNISIKGGESKTLLTGPYQTLTTYPLAIGGTFEIKFLNVAPNPIIESVMYPWMKECTIGYGEEANSYDLEYPRGDLTIAFPHLYKFAANLQDRPYYKYFNIRPVEIETYKPSNKPNDTMYRKVMFAFDYFAVLNVN